MGASAIAGNGLMRYGLSAAFPLFTTQMLDRLGHEWALSLVGIITVVLMPTPWLLYRWGAYLRSKSKFVNIEE